MNTTCTARTITTERKPYMDNIETLARRRLALVEQRDSIDEAIKAIDAQITPWTETAMSERRAHWDDALIEAVADLIWRDIESTSYRERAYQIIAAVEDWQVQHEIVSAPAVLIAQQAAIQRVRDEIQRWIDADDNEKPDAYYDGAHDALAVVKRALDGESDE